jgi:hypothetical protein
MKVPRQCPLVLLVKVLWRGGKTFGYEEGRDEKWRRDKVERGSTALNYTPEFRH